MLLEQMRPEQEMPSQTFARRVRELRENHRPRLTQEGLARRLMELQGVPDMGNVESFRVMVSRTEQGRRVATVDDLYWFARALDVIPMDLLEGMGGPLKDSFLSLQETVRQANEMFAEFERRALMTAAAQPEPIRSELLRSHREMRQALNEELEQEEEEDSGEHR
jgi:hypothetical protein